MLDYKQHTDNRYLTFSNNRYDEVMGHAKWYWKEQNFEYLVNWKSMFDPDSLIGDKSRLLNPSFIDFPNSATPEGDSPAWWSSIR